MIPVMEMSYQPTQQPLNTASVQPTEQPPPRNSPSAQPVNVPSVHPTCDVAIGSSSVAPRLLSSQQPLV